MRNEPCPCGSGKKAKKCCLASGRWDRRPLRVDLNPQQTATSHPKCLLARFGGCSNRLSREHFVSDAVLRAMISEADDGLVQVSGPPWTNGGKFKGVGARALVARILCTYHNSRLSVLDAEASSLWAGVRGMTRADTMVGQRVLLNGYDIERCFFKHLCGQLISGLSRCADGSRVDGTWFTDRQLEMIANERVWQSSRVCGLHYLSTRRRRVYEPAISFAALVSEHRREVLGARLRICGLEFLLAASPRVDPNYPAGFVRKYRPAGFRFNSEAGRSELLFSWNDDEAHPMITFGGGGVSTTLKYPHSKMH
jgi:hypothetical protein